MFRSSTAVAAKASTKRLQAALLNSAQLDTSGWKINLRRHVDAEASTLVRRIPN
jgi:hypothetical protein